MNSTRPSRPRANSLSVMSYTCLARAAACSVTAIVDVAWATRNVVTRRSRITSPNDGGTGGVVGAVGIASRGYGRQALSTAAIASSIVANTCRLVSGLAASRSPT